MAAGEFAQIVKGKLSALSGQSLAVWRKRPEQSAWVDARPRQGLEPRAGAIRRESLGMTGIRERALATRELSRGKDGLIKRAQLFYQDHHP